MVIQVHKKIRKAEMDEVLYKLRMIKGLEVTRDTYVVAYDMEQAIRYAQQCYLGEIPLSAEKVSNHVKVSRSVIRERFNEDE